MTNQQPINSNYQKLQTQLGTHCPLQERELINRDLCSKSNSQLRYNYSAGCFPIHVLKLLTT